MVTDSNNIPILSIGPCDDHQMALAGIFPRAKFYSCSRLDVSLKLLRDKWIPIVVCDSEFDWRGLLTHLGELPEQPFVIVTSRLADDRLWSEALNLGAYDVLAKPFDSTEVTRVLTMAWTRWLERSTGPFRAPRSEPLTEPAYA